MTEQTKTSTVVDSGVKTSLAVTTQKPIKSVFIERRISADTIGKEMASRIMGKILLDVDDLYDPKTQQFLSEDELKAKGAIFITIDYNKVLVCGKELVKKSRITKEPSPYIRKKYTMQMLLNIDWSNYVNRRNDENYEFIPSEKRKNGVVNFENCRGIGQTTAKNFTLNGIAFKVLTDVKYYDENGNEYTDIDSLKNEYFTKTVKAEQKSKQREADKHQIDVKFDPKYRTVRIDNCRAVRCFGFEYKPTE